MYVLSLGSQQGNSHVHWHVAPLPPGTPYHQQQYHALMAEHGIIRLDAGQTAALGARLRAVLDGPQR
jgi:histidine triad (HIT) family protein/ATP adenylyltransferase